jgi:hypothetical protein
MWLRSHNSKQSRLLLWCNKLLSLLLWCNKLLYQLLRLPLLYQFLSKQRQERSKQRQDRRNK